MDDTVAGSALAPGCGDSRRLGDGSRCAASHSSGDQAYSRRFLMKTSLKTPSDVVWETTSAPADCLSAHQEPLRPRFRESPQPGARAEPATALS